MDQTKLNAVAHLLRELLRKATADVTHRWNVMVVPQSANSVPFTFNVTRLMVRGSVLGVLLVMGLTIIGWSRSLRIAEEAHRAEVVRLEAMLNADRAAMQGGLEEAQTSLQMVRDSMVPLLESENKMRAIAGLSPRYRDAEVPMGGQGGRGSHPDVSDAVERLDPAELNLPPLPDWAEASVPELLAEFSLLATSYEAIEGALQEESSRLDSTPLINPVDHIDAWISSRYGYRTDPFTGKRRFHEGLDVVAPRGATILAPANGTVTYAGWKAGLGKLVVIKHGFGFETEYAHCDRLWVKKGETVVRGQRIAALGSTGRSTGAHLHYEVRLGGKLVNPYRYIIE